MKKHMAAVLYTVLLTSFTAFVLLDTFVLVHDTKDGSQIGGIYSSTEKNIAEDDVEEEDIIVTENSYIDDNISINISTLREYDTDIYIADVVVSDIIYLKTAFADGIYGRNVKEVTSDIAKENNAILAINGDFYGYRDEGYVLRNGVIYREDAAEDTDALVIYDDGNCESVEEGSVSLEELLENGAAQVLSFGPTLMEDGKVVASVDAAAEKEMRSNPRTAFGMITPLHYVFVVSDGRTDESDGLSIYELALIMEDYGCKYAYNLDGGGSSSMYFNGEIVNNPTDGRNDGERRVSDIVYIGY